MFARRADPGIGQRIADRLRDRVEASLLRRLIRMIEIELVDELVERHGEIGPIRPRHRSHLRQRLGTRHPLAGRLARLHLDRLREVAEPQLGHQRQRLVREELAENVAQPVGRGRPAGDAETASR